MKFSDWHVMKDINDKHFYLYGDLDDHDLNGLVELKLNDWTSNDFAEILSNEFEDRNMHSLTGLPNRILDCMCNANIMECQRRSVMKMLASDYLE